MEYTTLPSTQKQCQYLVTITHETTNTLFSPFEIWNMSKFKQLAWTKDLKDAAGLKYTLSPVGNAYLLTSFYIYPGMVPKTEVYTCSDMVHKL